MKTKQIQLILFCLGLVPFALWLFNYLNADLWYDEVHSFHNFVLGDFSITLLNYPVPNNHVFFNFTSQVITRILNLRNINQIADHVYLLRLFQALLTLLTALYSVRIIKKIFNFEYSNLLIPILFTTIPFMNFSLQLRGYNMSSLLLVMIVYYSWSFIENKSKRSGIFIVICGALLLYTIPSNIYMLASVLTFYFIFFIANRKQNKVESFKFMKVNLFILVGIFVCIILYLPILNDIIFNKYAAREASSVFQSLELIPQLFIDFLSKRYALVVLILIGLWLFVYHSEKKEKQLLFFLFFLFVFPFVLSFIHHKFPLDRIFITLSPIYCILITVLILKFIMRIQNKTISLFCLFVIPVYCFFVFQNEIKNNNKEISDKLVNHDEMAQDIYQNYFLSDSFDQNETITFLKSKAGNRTVVLFKQLDYPSTYMYLSKYGVNFVDLSSREDLIKTILKNRKTLILTSSKNQLTNALKGINNLKSEVIMNKYAFSNIIQIENRNKK